MRFLEEGALLLVALLWGATNPFIRKGSVGVEQIRGDNPIQRKIAELVFLGTRWNYIIPFALNQLGSAIFLYSLQGSDLTLAVPVTNSLAFVVTAIVSAMVGEQVPTWRSYFGIIMIIIGTTVCMFEKDGLYL